MHLTCEAVALIRSGTLVLRDITLDIPSGARVCVSGPAGSGKTSLAKLLVGLLLPSGGHLRWSDQDVSALSALDRRHRQASFGMVFQTDALFDSLSALENVTAPLRRRGWNADSAAQRAHEVLEQVGLLAAASALPETLSGGMKKRLGLARALAGKPEVLVADDPVAGLDPQNARNVWRLIDESSRGKTLVVCGSPSAGHLVFDHVVHLLGGRVAA